MCVRYRQWCVCVCKCVRGWIKTEITNVTREDRYRTDRILNKLHQILPHFRLSLLVLTRQGFLLFLIFRTDAPRKAKMSSFSTINSSLKAHQWISGLKPCRKRSLVSGNKLWVYFFFLSQDLSNSIILVWPAGMTEIIPYLVWTEACRGKLVQRKSKPIV